LFPAFLDTCVLYSSTLRDTLLRIAEADAFRPLWSAHVLAELKSVLEREAHVDSGKTSRLIGQLQQAFPASEVVDYDALIDATTCHPKDRHVLAAAVAGGAQVVVTFNVKDFPAASVEPHDIEVVNPDGFLLDQLDLYPGRVGRALVGQLTAAKRPPLTMGQLLGRLARAGVADFADEVRRHEFA
jgi:predicted nucleic acid-binding protein